jgi:RHS repeat-associated protein
VRQEYDSAGDLRRSFATLSGTLPLDRFHEANDGVVPPTVPVAPPPANASGGIDDPVEIQTIDLSRDVFGSVTGQRMPLGRCRTILFDPDYATLPVRETVFGGALDAQTGCGQHAFVTEALYDRGLTRVLSVTSVTGQPSRFDYDAFGRLIAKTFADPENPGQLAEYAAATYDYLLPAEASLAPYSIVVVRRQDGENANDPAYHESYAYVDGLGRTLVDLSEADPLAGDGGDYVASGVRHYDKKGGVLRAHQPWFVTADPLAFPLDAVPPTAFAGASYDAFGRVVFGFGLDGEAKVFNDYHALSQDTWDAADLALGPHGGSFGTTIVDGHGRTVHAIERVKVGTSLELRHQLREYLPTGELRSITQRRTGAPDVVRWLRYDSLGRLVLNAEPNTSQGFDPDPATDPNTLKAWRYAYDDTGNLVGMSDARGCGVNYFFDTAGRLTAEDYSPCETGQQPYSAPDFGTGSGIEVAHHFDTPDASLGVIADAAGTAFTFDASLYWGRAVSVADRGSRGVVRYDALGRVTAGAIQIAKPGSAAPDPSARYTPRWYVTETAFDGAHRPVEATTGATLSELLGTAGRSVVTYQYSARGAVASVSSSYGTLLASSTIDADGRLLHAVLGDAAGTERSYGYDQLRRLSNVQLYRPGAELWTTPAYPVSSELTQQLLLEDYVFAYDPANNVTEITDYRIPDEWPAGAKPVTRNFEYDDTYRLTRTTFDYPGGGDPWTSPFAAENMASSSGPEPSPHVEFSGRIEEQQHKYDHLGNITESADDQNGFQDRSLGTQEHGSPDLGPHQLLSATNRAIAPTSLNQGDLETGYDAAGNLTDLVIRRDGPCLPAGSSCWQRYTYHWDELGQLDRAQRWDLAGAERIDNDQLGDPAPGRAADVELRYAYDSAGQRVLKTAVDPAGEQIHTVYISASYELRRTTFAGGDYELTRDTVALYVSGGGVRGRVLYSEEDLPSLSSGHQRLFLELGDHLGSSNVIIDHETGELVEYATYQPYGATESDYRPERWGQFREAYKFTGKEEDVEVGLQYFGARYLVVGLQRWASPDPAAIHGIRAFNPYSYVEGRPLVAVDPDGRLAFLAVVAIAIVVSAVIAGGVSVGTQVAANDWDFSKRIDWGQVGIAAGTGAIVGGLSAATGGVAGTLVGGMFSSPVAGAIIGGAAGGAVGGATGYVGTWAVGNALGTETPEFSGWGLLGAAVAGAAVGAASASLAYKFGGEPAAALDKDTVYDGTTVDATKDFGERYHDASVLEKREYYTTTWEKDGQTLLKQPAAGPPCSDLECGPPSDAELARLTESPGEGWKFTGVEHTHPRSNEFSAQTPYDLGDEGSANALAANHDGAKSYMISPSDGVRSLPGPMPHGNWETNMSYVHRLSPRWGMMGTAAGTGIGTYLHPVKTENR